MIDSSLKKHFAVLGYEDLSKPPTREELKKRWRDLCHKHHPDKGGSEEEFVRVTHSYEMLTNPEYRHRHEVDESRRSNHNNFGDLNIRIHLPVSFDTAFFGQDVVVSYNRLELGDDLSPITGKTLDVVTEMIVIPPGSTGGHEVEIPKGGHLYKGSYGKALVVIAPLPHSRFSVQHLDVLSREAIPLDVLLRGGKVEVMTMYGMKTLRVPAGTKPGSQLKIRGCGVSGVGDHIISAEALFPSKEELKTKEAWTGLGVNWEEEESKDARDDDLFNLYKTIKEANPNIVFRVIGD